MNGYGYIYQLYSTLGYDLYNSYNSKLKKALFCQMTSELMQIHCLADNDKLYLYSNKPSIDMICNLFNKALKNPIQIVDIDSDDFAWKPRYRNACKEVDMDLSKYFLSQLESPLNIEIPAGGTLRVGLGQKDLPDIVNDFAAIFLGRVPGTLCIKLEPEKEFSMSLPEIPWMIVCSSYNEDFFLQGVKVTPMVSECKNYGIIGMGVMDLLIDKEKDVIQFKIKVLKEDYIRIIFPFNAFAINSGCLSMKTHPSFEGSYSYATN